MRSVLPHKSFQFEDPNAPERWPDGRSNLRLTLWRQNSWASRRNCRSPDNWTLLERRFIWTVHLRNRWWYHKENSESILRRRIWNTSSGRDLKLHDVIHTLISGHRIRGKFDISYTVFIRNLGLAYNSKKICQFFDLHTKSLEALSFSYFSPMEGQVSYKKRVCCFRDASAQTSWWISKNSPPSPPPSRFPTHSCAQTTPQKVSHTDPPKAFTIPFPQTPCSFSPQTPTDSFSCSQTPTCSYACSWHSRSHSCCARVWRFVVIRL